MEGSYPASYGQSVLTTWQSCSVSTSTSGDATKPTRHRSVDSPCRAVPTVEATAAVASAEIYTTQSRLVRPPGTLVPKAFCFSRDVFLFIF